MKYNFIEETNEILGHCEDCLEYKPMNKTDASNIDLFENWKCKQCEEEQTEAERNFQRDFGAVLICKHKELI